MDDWLGIILDQLNHVVRAIMQILMIFDFLAFATNRLMSISYLFRLTVSPAKIYGIIFVNTIGLKKPPYAFCMTLLQSLAARTYYQRKV